MTAPSVDEGRSDVPIAGWCAPGLEAVHRAFRENFTERGEVGAALCVVRDGETVVDLWGGWADAARRRPWQRDTIVDFYSVGKALVATLLLREVDRGSIDLDTPVTDVWPEFAAGGKGAVTIRQALSHQAAVPAIRQRLTNDSLWDWSAMTDAVAGTDAWWPIGTRHAYHTNTYGFIVGEIARRITGEPPGDAFRTLAGDLDADVWFGVPDAEQPRCADVIWDSPRVPGLDDVDLSTLDADAQMNVLAHFNPPGTSSIGVVNTAAWRSAVIPSTNGHGNARGVARFFDGLLDDGRVLSRGLRSTAATPQSIGPCPILGENVAFGLGFTPTTTRRPLGPNAGSFGHFGTGGALGFADPVGGIAFGYVMNHVIPRWQSTRNRAVIDALYAALG